MVIKKFDKYFLKTYNRFDIEFVKGEGKYLYDSKGKKYLDFFSGLSVCNLGHCNKKIVSALKNQAEKLWHTSNYYYHSSQIEFSKLIVEKSFPGKIFFSNSGAEANECAIKIARKYGSLNQKSKIKNQKYEIITFYNSFHGRTIATITATGQQKFQKGFEPLLSGFKYAKFNNIDSVKKLITNKTIAIMIEPILGEGGVVPAEKKFLQELRNLCDQHGLLLIFDEVQTGFGRTGKFWAYQYYNVKPDILTMAKSIANGLPLGATLVDKKYEDVFNFGDHGSTFGGNILSCTAGIEVVKQIDKKLLANVQSVGKYFYKKLTGLKNKYSFITEVRGVGLILGIELTFSGRDIVQTCLEHGLVINVTQDNVLRFLPPLIINKTDVDSVTETLEKIFKDIYHKNNKQNTK